MNLEKVPEPWRTQMQNKGISSIRDFSRKSGLSVETVRQAVYGTRKSSPPTAKALADTLGVEVAHVNEWLGHGRSDSSAPYEPPAEASRLTLRQRKALDELIRSMTVQEARHDRQDDTEPGPEAGGTQHGSESSSEDGGTPGRPGAPMSDELAERRKPWKNNLPPQPSPETIADLDRRQQEADATSPEEIAGWAAWDDNYPTPDGEE